MFIAFDEPTPGDVHAKFTDIPAVVIRSLDELTNQGLILALKWAIQLPDNPSLPLIIEEIAERFERLESLEADHYNRQIEGE